MDIITDDFGQQQSDDYLDVYFPTEKVAPKRRATFVGKREPRIRPTVANNNGLILGDEVEAIPEVAASNGGYKVPAKITLNTITPEVYYACLTQPLLLKRFMKGDGVQNIQLTRERRLFYLANCLVFYPKDLESTFNVEIPAPYDYQVADFARHLTAAINKKIKDTGEIDEAEVPLLKKYIYNSRTYTIPQEVIERELADNQDYITYLLNVDDKINISTAELELIQKAIENKRDHTKEGPGVDHNLPTFSDFVDNNGFQYVLAATIPQMIRRENAIYLRAALYVDELYPQRFSLESLNPSFSQIDIALISKIVKDNYPTCNVVFTVEVFDKFANSFSVSLTDKTLNELIASVLTGLKTTMTGLSGGKISLMSIIDKRLANGQLTI